MLNLRGVDLNLLPVFEAAYEELTLTRAADRLAMTQSAVSHALTRLRDLFNDELFVRTGRGVAPTPAADALYAKLRGALSTVRESVSEARGFEPATTTRSFFISVSHPLGPLIAVRLREQLAQVAPRAAIAFTTRSRPVELDRGLREGKVDAAVDWVLPGRGSFNESALFNDSIVAVARNGHPHLRRTRTIDDLKSGEFVSLRARVEGGSPTPGIREWAQLKLKVALEVSEILEVFLVASQSDLFGLIPRSMLTIARTTFGLRPIPVAVTTRTVPVKLFWPAGKDADAAHLFVRKQIESAARAVVGRGVQ